MNLYEMWDKVYNYLNEGATLESTAIEQFDLALLWSVVLKLHKNAHRSLKLREVFLFFPYLFLDSKIKHALISTSVWAKNCMLCSSPANDESGNGSESFNEHYLGFATMQLIT